VQGWVYKVARRLLSHKSENTMTKRIFSRLLLAVCMGATAHVTSAADFNITVPMKAKGAATFYVPANIQGYGAVDLMVDTGSGYMTINEEALVQLKRSNNARYIKDLRGILANGSEMVVPVYNLAAVNIGGSCWLKDVEAAVFPGKTRFILGLSVLQKASPFIFSTEPASLVLSNCVPAPMEAMATSDVAEKLPPVSEIIR
jgi:predicted aspartyl protease